MTSNIIYEYLPMILTATHNLRTGKDARKLAATLLLLLALMVTCLKNWPMPS